MKTYVASKNRGKIDELRAIFAGSPLDLELYPAYRDVEEGETGYVENALLKARALAAQLHEAGVGAAVLADDSGIEVEALGNRPGVLSARYAGADASWDERLSLMLHELAGVPDESRSGRFVCAMALILPGGVEVTAVGTVEGLITRRPHGRGGFGYDPIFFYPPRGCTFADLSAPEKNALSHRGRAACALLEALQERV